MSIEHCVGLILVHLESDQHFNKNYYSTQRREEPKNPAYGQAIQALKTEGAVSERVVHQQIKYRNRSSLDPSTVWIIGLNQV
ncbi:MAG: transposase [Gammaproteobacteria bacterium]|nr:transposase [Gammaproteobacteria bacterium]